MNIDVIKKDRGENLVKRKKKKYYYNCFLNFNFKKKKKKKRMGEKNKISGLLLSPISKLVS